MDTYSFLLYLVTIRRSFKCKVGEFEEALTDGEYIYKIVAIHISHLKAVCEEIRNRHSQGIYFSSITLVFECNHS